ncbi:putative PurR-regulated permease PerM [Natronocella acetinitrilica]|uniref:PurR-regulated permease PerM n=1 Tax=Natronocella acetinitrilica TaxID=414046 RepID=A0AAE3G5D3_9GAMM|nr:AI-2E family transporter [Natronocella acetinitrilica]MCP1675428.1 putative PurR-regulated permease PerM [Natronocella acetinitrilica]
MDSKRWIRTDTILLTAGLLLIGYLLGDLLLLVFAAVLLAVGLDGLSRSIAGWLPVSRGWALLGVTIGIAAVIIGSLGMSAAGLVQQFREVSETVLDFAERVHAWLTELGMMTMMEDMNVENGVLSGAAGETAAHIMTAFGAVASLIILVVLTLFLAAKPGLYRQGAIRLVPPDKRELVDNTLSAVAHALRWWFLGQFVSMALLGGTVALGLFALGIDLWFALGVLTALLTFIPFIGPIMAAVPIVAVGFTEGMQTGLIVLVGYFVIQNIEGNVVVPMIQHKAVNLAPALLISVQVLFGLVFGAVGLILAAPLTIVAMVSVQKLWVEHTLGDKLT